jgi:amidase
LGDYTKGYESGRGSAFTRPFNVTGQPAISVPLGWPDDGLPRGVQLVAPIGRDDLLITVAAALETAEPWSHRRPPVSA